MFNYRKVAELEDRLSTVTQQNKNLVSYLTRVANHFRPSNAVPIFSDYGVQYVLNYLNQADSMKQIKAEREKIEQIVLDLKNRKWEPAE